VVLLEVDLSLHVVGHATQVGEFDSGDGGYRNLAVLVGDDGAADGQISTGDGSSGTGDGVLLGTYQGLHLLQRGGFERVHRIAGQHQSAGHGAASQRQVFIQRTASGDGERLG